VKQELAHEEEEYESDETLATPPNDYTLTEVPGNTLMKLTKKHGKEDVSIVVNLIDQGDEEVDELEEGDENMPKFPIQFVVDCTKAGQTLQFSCVFMEDDVEIHVEHVAMLDAGAEPSSDAYEGPNFTELDENLQKELYSYLEERGVTAELGQWLCRLLFDKETREYKSWLQKLGKFAST
jgi:hypothetical protein